MKKIFSAFLMFTSFFSVNAMSDFSNRNLCAGISFPYMNHDYEIGDMDTVTLSGIGLNLNFRQMREEMNIGIFLDADIFLPFSKTIAIDEKTSSISKFSDYEYFFGIDALAGIYTVLFRDGTFNFPVGAGFHIEGFISKEKYDDVIIRESTYTLGLGAWFNLEVNFSKKFGIYAGSKIIYDFYYKFNNRALITTLKDGTCKCWSIVPSVGLLRHF